MTRNFHHSEGPRDLARDDDNGPGRHGEKSTKKSSEDFKDVKNGFYTLHLVYDEGGSSLSGLGATQGALRDKGCAWATTQRRHAYRLERGRSGYQITYFSF